MKIRKAETSAASLGKRWREWICSYRCACQQTVSHSAVSSASDFSAARPRPLWWIGLPRKSTHNRITACKQKKKCFRVFMRVMFTCLSTVWFRPRYSLRLLKNIFPPPSLRVITCRLSGWVIFQHQTFVNCFSDGLHYVTSPWLSGSLKNTTLLVVRDLNPFLEKD